MPRPRRAPGPPAPAASSSLPQPAPAPPRTSSTDFEICVYDLPRYRPGSTPPQPPISLMPVHDTDAFIVGKIVTPFGVADDDDDDEADADEDSDLEFEELRQRALQRLVAATAAASPGSLQKQQQQQTVRRVLNYVVGWPDVPYARQLVPCTEVLDYVSPRTLEDWEYAATLRQHAAAAAAAAAAAQKKGHKAHKAAGVPEVPPVKHEVEGETPAAVGTGADTAAANAVVQPSHPPGGPQRKRRRARRKLLGPTKKRKATAPPAATEAPPTPAAAAATAAADADTPKPFYAQAHSATTTPRASKLFGAVAASDGVYASASPTSVRLIHTMDVEHRPRSSSAAIGTIDAMASPASDRQQLLAHSIPSLASGKQRTGLSLTQPYRPATSTSADGNHNPFAAAAAATGASAGGSGYLHVASGSMDRDELYGDDWTNSSNSRVVGVAAADGAGDDMFFGDTAPMSTANGTEEDEDDDEDGEDGIEPEDAKTQQQDKPAHRVTYIPPPAPPYHFSPSQHRAGSVASLGAVPRPESPQCKGTSVNTLKRKRETQDAAAAQMLVGDDMVVDGEEENAYDEDAAEEEEEEEDLYEVDCIEDDYLLERDENGHRDSHKRSRVGKAQGRSASPAPVRFFLVRWKGDWPPDQNPTWEPAENLPPDMVRQYLKKTARQKTKGGSSRSANGRSGS